MTFGFSPLCMSVSANLCEPSVVTLPSSTLTPRLVPSLLLSRTRPARGGGARVESDRRPALRVDVLLELRLHGRLAARKIDRVDAAVGAHRVEHVVRRADVEAQHLAGNPRDLPGLDHGLLAGVDDRDGVV